MDNVKVPGVSVDKKICEKPKKGFDIVQVVTGSVFSLMLLMGCVAQTPPFQSPPRPELTTKKMFLMTFVFEGYTAKIQNVHMNYGSAKMPETRGTKTPDYWIHLVGDHKTVKIGIRDPRKQTFDEGPDRGQASNKVGRKEFTLRIPFHPKKVGLQKVEILKGGIVLDTYDVEGHITQFCADKRHKDCESWREAKNSD